MPKTTRTIRLERLEGQVGHVAYQMTQIHFRDFRAPEHWRPAINAYRCEHGLRICVDLAGVEREEIRLGFAPGRLVISGRRALPEPDAEHSTMQVLAMEIDHGGFERQINLPLNVDGSRVTAEQQNGLLWVHLPFLHH